jgi:hypothetical protein
MNLDYSEPIKPVGFFPLLLPAAAILGGFTLLGTYAGAKLQGEVVDPVSGKPNTVAGSFASSLGQGIGSSIGKSALYIAIAFMAYKAATKKGWL